MTEREAEDLFQVWCKNETVVIPWGVVQDLMDAPSAGIRRFAYEILDEESMAQRLSERPDPERTKRFIVGFLADCVKGQLCGDPGYSPYLAAWEFVRLLARAWERGDVALVREIKRSLEELYKNGSSSVRQCVVVGVLEPYIGTREWRQIFSDWRSDPDLAQALHDARP